MFILPPQVKLALQIVLVVFILGLVFTANHYHNSWVSAKETIAKMEISQAQLKISADNCSRGTEDLLAKSKAKEEDVKKAQIQANILAKNNEILSQVLLGAKPEGLDKCKAAVKLFQEYKDKKESK